MKEWMGSKRDRAPGGRCRVGRFKGWTREGCRNGGAGARRVRRVQGDLEEDERGGGGAGFARSSNMEMWVQQVALLVL